VALGSFKASLDDPPGDKSFFHRRGIGVQVVYEGMVRSGETTTKTGALVFLLAGFGSFSVVHAEQFGTAEEARAMLDRAIAALNANQARALSEFNNTKNTQLHDRDLYISCYNIADGKFTAFPSRAMIGADIREMKLQNDCDEVQFPEARGGQASSKGIPRGAHRQSGLRRELLQIASKKKFKQVIGLLRCQCSQAAITSSPIWTDADLLNTGVTPAGVEGHITCKGIASEAGLTGVALLLLC
jgi:hypothetical protein